MVLVVSVSVRVLSKAISAKGRNVYGLVGDFRFFLDGMRQYNNSLTMKEVKDTVLLALVGGPQLVDPVPQKIRLRPPQFVSFCRKLQNKCSSLVPLLLR